MPRKPKRPCSYPRCPNLTDGRFCEEHAKLEAKHYERYQRDPEAKRRYGRAWKRIRDNYAATHPLCEVCLKKGMYTPTEQIHHIKPLSQGGTHDRDNLMALCKSCHARIHAEQGVILSRLVDTFSSRILYSMLPLSGNHSIAVV